MTAYEQQRLAEIWPSAEGVTEVTVGRRYDETRTVGIEASSAVPFDLAAIKADARNIAGAVKAKATNLSEDVKSELERASTTFVTAISVGETAAKWAATATAALDSLRQALATADVELTDTHPRRACARSPRG